MKTVNLHQYLEKDPRMIRRILMDLVWVLLIALIPVAMYQSDPVFLARYGRFAGIIALTALVPVAFAEAIKGSRKLALSAAALIQIGLILQLRLIHPDQADVAAESMRMILDAAFAVTAGTLLGPGLFWLIRSVCVRRPILILNMSVAAVYMLLICTGTAVNGSRCWICVGSLCMPVTALLAVPVLVIFGLIITDINRSDRWKIRDMLLTLAMNAVFLLAVNTVSMLVVLAVVCILLCAIYLSKAANAVKLLLALVLGAGAVALALYGCGTAAENMELTGMAGQVLHVGAEFYRKISLRLALLLDPGSMDIFGSGYQAHRANMAIATSKLLGAAAGETAVPAGETDFAFCMLLNQMGLLAGAAVLALLVVLVHEAASLCRRTADHGVGGAGMAFVLMMSVQSLLAASANVGLLFPTGESFLFLARSGSAMCLCCLMLSAILWAGRPTECSAAGRRTGGRASVVLVGMYVWAALIMLRTLIIWY